VKFPNELFVENLATKVWKLVILQSFHYAYDSIFFVTTPPFWENGSYHTLIRTG